MESKHGDESRMTHNDVFPANFTEIMASLPRGPPCSIFPSLCLYRGFLTRDDGNTRVPRLLSTHLPYSLVPRRATADIIGGGSGCRIVYVARDPKDTLVSAWHFDASLRWSVAAEGREGAAGAAFDEAFELYCQGHCGMGPQWEHVRGYWEASKRRPRSVLFLRYEEMLQYPAGKLKKMAEFMGCPFSAAEDDTGVVRSILELCSLDKQRSLAVNKTGARSVLEGLVVTTAVENKHFFRKGIMGDWRNHMTSEMASKLDGIVEVSRDQDLPLGTPIQIIRT